jgi:hypothetical protein
MLRERQVDPRGRRVRRPRGSGERKPSLPQVIDDSRAAFRALERFARVAVPRNHANAAATILDPAPINARAHFLRCFFECHADHRTRADHRGAPAYYYHSRSRDGEDRGSRPGVQSSSDSSTIGITRRACRAFAW